MIDKAMIKDLTKAVNNLGVVIRSGKKPHIIGNKILALTQLEIDLVENYGGFPTDDEISYAMHDISKYSCEEMPNDKRRKPHYYITSAVYDCLYMSFNRGLVILKLEKMINSKKVDIRELHSLLSHLDRIEGMLDAYSFDIPIFYDALADNIHSTDKDEINNIKKIIKFIKNKKSEADRKVYKIA